MRLRQRQQDEEYEEEQSQHQQQHQLEEQSPRKQSEAGTRGRVVALQLPQLQGDHIGFTHVATSI